MFDQRSVFIITSGIILCLSGCEKVKNCLSPNSHTTWQPIHTPTLHNDIITRQEILSGKYSLLELIEIGLQQNPQTKSAWWQAKEALANKGQAEANFFPKINAQFNINRQQEGKL